MRTSVWLLLSLLTLCLNAQSNFADIFEQKFTAEQLEEDFAILRQGLEKIHPGLYRYSTKEELDAWFDQTHAELKEGLSYQEFYRKVCLLIAQIKCQHTIATPEPKLLNQIAKKGQFFPLWVFWEFEPLKAYAGVDYSSEVSLPPGTKIISINGQSIPSIYSTLIPFFPTDGEILSNQHSRLAVGVEFQFWYFLLIDQPTTYTVELEDANGNIFSKTYQAVTFRQWNKNHKKYARHKDPEIRKLKDHYTAQEKLNNTQPIRCEFLSDEVALLKVMNFHHHKFEEIIAEAFQEIKARNVEHLIIDVRYNGGGSDILGRTLFSYLIDKPSVYFDSLYTSSGIADTAFLFKYTDKNPDWFEATRPLVELLPDGRFATKPEVNEGLLIQQPKEAHFEGDVYVLMHGRSASTTAEFTAATHFHKRATFIGEESGGAYHGGHGGDFANLRLPNTQITVEIPLTKYVMNSSEDRYMNRGTLPDYEVSNTVQDFLDLKDTQLEFVLKLIEQKKGKKP